MAQVFLNVPDISCGHCERAIQNALTSVAGVQQVRVDIPAKQVQLNYDPAQVSLDRVQEILKEEDYPVASVVASAAQAPTTEASNGGGCGCGCGHTPSINDIKVISQS